MDNEENRRQQTNNPQRGGGRRKRDQLNQVSSSNSQQDNNQQIEEAEEEKNVIIEDYEEQPESEESGEDLMENQEQDYKQRPELDQYEQEGIDDEQNYSDLDAADREMVDQQLNERDREQLARLKRIPGALQYDELEFEEDFQKKQQRYKERLYDMDLEDDDDSQAMQDEERKEEEEKFLDHEESRGKLHIWIKEPRTVRWIRKTFKKFIKKFKDPITNKLYYVEKIQEMCNKNKQSLEVNAQHLKMVNLTLLVWITYEPAIILPYLNNIAMECATDYYATYEELYPEIYVKIIELDINDKIRELRQNDIGHLIKIRGVVTKRSVVFNQLKKIFYICSRCGERKGPIYENQNQEIKLGACVNCQSKGPFKIDTADSVYRNYQKITIQESPGTVPPGRVPRQKEVILLGDNIDVARPGDEVEITGIFQQRYDYLLNINHGFPVFQTIIEANYVKRIAEIENNELPEEEIQEIRKFAKKANISSIIINSIAPSIHGHMDVKTALALSMFGGEAKDVGGKHKIRGDINVLLLGDPGTAKSQFLKCVEKTFSRCVYTTGKGASAVGLTASVRKDPVTREWMLEGGALVLADKGICVIDEFDKMNEHDRTSIHEAMEQQSISISKAGIVASLQARCAVIAAANPIQGRYNSQQSFMDNVNLTDPILSRFDILCVIKDEVEIDMDTKLATFVINSHIKNHPYHINKKQETFQNILLDEKNVSQQSEIMSQEFLRKYIMFARQHCHPKITSIDRDKIIKFYTELRAESQISGGMIIAVRHIESIIRSAEAHAKMHLREIVRDDDIDMSISVLMQSFIQSQKYSVAKLIESKFKKYINIKDDLNFLLYKSLNKLMKERASYMKQIIDQDVEIKIPIQEFEMEAKNMKIYDLTQFFRSPQFTNHFMLKGNVITVKVNQTQIIQ